jgi:signal transduction histidine kinase/ligand-binding sensor domain-containing protein
MLARRLVLCGVVFAKALTALGLRVAEVAGGNRPGLPAFGLLTAAVFANTVLAYEPQYADPLLESFRWHRIAELTEKSYRCIAEGPDGTIWFGVESGVLAYDGAQWKSYPLKSGGKTAVLSICVAADGTVFAANDQVILRLQGDLWQRVLPATGDWEFGIYKLTWTPDGSLWAGTNYGLLRIKDGKAVVYGPQKCLTTLRAANSEPEPRAIPGLDTPNAMFPVYNVERAEPGKLLVRARDGIYCLTYDGTATPEDSWRKLSDLKKYWHPMRSTVVCRAADGAVWGLGDNGIVIRIVDGSTERWDLRKLMSGDVTVSIAEGSDGSIWVGGQGSLFLFKDGVWRSYAPPDIPGGGAARITVLAASDDTIWIASEQNDVYRVDYFGRRWLTLQDLNFGAQMPDGRLWFLAKDGRVVSASEQLSDWESFGPEAGLIESPLTLYCTRQGQLWAAGSQGQEAAVSYFDGQKWHSKKFPALSWGIDYRSVCEAKDGSLWFGAAANAIEEKGQHGGVLRFDPVAGAFDDQRAWRIVNLPQARTSTYGIGQTADGMLWFGGLDLYAYDPVANARIRDLPIPFPADARIENVHATPDGRLWVATRNYGVASYDGKEWKHFDVSNGLVHNTVIAAYELKDGGVLLSTDRDISRFDGTAWTNYALPNEFNMQREGGGFRQARDGSIWINISSRGWKRRALDRDIYAPEQQQFWTCRYLPERNAPTTVIALYEPEVSSRGNTIIAWSGADPWHATDQKDLRFSYRFDSGEWSPFTEETQRAFTSLGSGAHTFEVRARDMDFNVDPDPPKIRFHVARPLWQQPWFVGLMGLLAVALAASFRSYHAHRWNCALREVNAELEQRVARRTAELEDTNRELEAFAHSVSHDLRAPLRAMEGFAVALIEDYGNSLDEQGREFIGHIAASAKRMDALIRDLLDYSRLGRADLAIKPTSLDDVVHAALGEVASDVAAANAEVTVAETLPTVLGHRTTLIQMAANLISNAIKFVRPGVRPEIRIWTEPTGCGRIRLVVEDNGIGIEARHQARIFGIFERLHGVERYPGTGVGLAIVARACERLGGSCGVESVAGQGSRFWVELPCHGKNRDDE